MQYGLSIQVHWAPEKHDSAAVFRKAKEAATTRLKQLFKKLSSAFPDFPCEYNGLGTAELRVPDEKILSSVISWMDKQKEKYQIVVISYWTIDELAQARWLPLHYTYANSDTVQCGLLTWRPLNQYPRVLCKQCGWYDEAVVPTPYKINHEVLRRKEEIFGAENGLLIVKERVKALLAEVAGDQFEWGEATPVDASGKRIKSTRDQGRIFWIRPKALIGRDLDDCTEAVACEKCGAMFGYGGRDISKAKVVRQRMTVEHFGDKRLNIACAGNWLGPLPIPEGENIWRPVFFSGGLWAYLYNCGVKGLILPEQGLYSAKGEAPLEPERRFANLKTGKDDKFMRLKMWWQRQKK